MSSPSHLEDILHRDGVLVYKTRGVSMRPLLKQDRDLVIIRPFEGRLKKYDVPLYRCRGGGYVLHRIIAVRDHDYVIRGDNTFRKEYVPDSLIIGVLTDFKRKGREHSVNETGYRLYARVWNVLYPIRFALHKARGVAGRIKRKLKGNTAT